MVEALVGSIRDVPIGEERDEGPLARREERPVALDVEKRLLLAGEACIREVLCGRAAPDRHAARLRGVCAQAVVGLGDGLLEVCREARSEDSLAHLASPLPEILEIVRIQILQDVINAPVEFKLVKEIPVAPARDGTPL